MCKFTYFKSAAFGFYKPYMDYLGKDNDKPVWLGSNTEDGSEMFELAEHIGSLGYRIYTAKSINALGSVHPSPGLAKEKTDMGYAVFLPYAEEDPIVIAYRGTASLQDLKEGAFLTALGVTSKQFRDEAYMVYKEMRRLYPHKKIILTGHSLGGSLARYVAVKASAQELDEENIYVRTFNPGGLSTIHEKQMLSSKNNNIVASNIFNYRLYNDKVSWMSGPGQTITILGSSPQTEITAHRLRTITQEMPKHIQEIVVGGKNSHIDTLKEALIGIENSFAAYGESCYLIDGISSLVKGSIQKNSVECFKSIKEEIFTTLEQTNINKKEKLHQAAMIIEHSLERIRTYQTKLPYIDTLINDLKLWQKRCQEYEREPTFQPPYYEDLTLACLHGKVDTVKDLLKIDTPVTSELINKALNSTTCSCNVINCTHFEIIKLLLDKAKEDKLTIKNSRLFERAFAPHRSLLNLILEYEIRNDGGETVLDFAFSKKDPHVYYGYELLETAVELKLDLNKQFIFTDKNEVINFAIRGQMFKELGALLHAKLSEIKKTQNPALSTYLFSFFSGAYSDPKSSWNLRQLINHGIKAYNNTRLILIDLGWLDSYGNINPNSNLVHVPGFFNPEVHPEIDQENLTPLKQAMKKAFGEPIPHYSY